MIETRSTTVDEGAGLERLLPEGQAESLSRGARHGRRQSPSVYLYLCSGEVLQVHNARSFELTSDEVRVLRVGKRKPVILSRDRVYFCSRFSEPLPVQF